MGGVSIISGSLLGSAGCLSCSSIYQYISKKHLATVASVASLLTQKVCGCNEFYHLKCSLDKYNISILFFCVKNLLVSQITLQTFFANLPPRYYRISKLTIVIICLSVRTTLSVLIPSEIHL